MLQAAVRDEGLMQEVCNPMHLSYPRFFLLLVGREQTKNISEASPAVGTAPAKSLERGGHRPQGSVWGADGIGETCFQIHVLSESFLNSTYFPPIQITNLCGLRFKERART